MFDHSKIGGLWLEHASDFIVRVLVLLADSPACLLLFHFLDRLADPLDQPVSAFLLLGLRVALKAVLKSVQSGELCVAGLHGGHEEEVDVARVGVGAIVHAVFDPLKEVVSKRRKELLLARLAEATAHLLQLLKAEIHVLEDVHEGFSLVIGIGVCGLAEFLRATDHVSLVELC